MNLSQHTFDTPEEFESLINRFVDFFNSTPLYKPSKLDKFSGSGIYSLYYDGDFNPYKPLANESSSDPTVPIYVGKAVPKGWRQGREGSDDDPKLYNRMREHFRNIKKGNHLSLEDFSIRFTIMQVEDDAADLIPAAENALIREYKPLWNSCVDGFGNHDPGDGRYDQAPSEWDTLHPGRSWVEKLTGDEPSLSNIKDKIREHLDETL